MTGNDNQVSKSPGPAAAHVNRGRLLRLVLLAGAVGAGGFLFLREPAPVEVIGLSPQVVTNLVIHSEGEGQLSPLNEAFATAIHGGRLERILVQPGTMVSAGQTLGIIDATDRTARLKSILSTHGATATDVRRLQALVDSGAATRQELDDMRTRLMQQRAELEQAKINLENGVLRSPISGRVSTVAFKTGDFVPDGSRVFAVENTGEMLLSFKIPFEDKKSLPKEGTVTVFEDAQGDTPPKETTLRGTFDVENRDGDFDGLFTDVRMRLSTSEAEGVPRGRILKVRVPLKTIERAVLVERRALTYREGKPMVFAYEPDKRTLRAVEAKVGDAVGDKVVLLSPDMGTPLVDPDIAKLEKVLAGKIKVTLKAPTPN